MIGNKVCFFETLDSTNTFMKNHLSDYHNGDIVCSRIQSNGRGRRSNSWFSVEGNLHFSYVIANDEKKDISFDIVMLVSNVVCEILKEYGIKATIKYPNDILVGTKKIAGILIERVLGEVDAYVVGVGLNVDAEDFGDLANKATSIYLETKDTNDYRDVLWAFIKEYNKIINCKHCNLYEMYLKRSIILGQKLIIEEEEYLVKGINIVGELVLNKDGKEYIKQLNEITLKEYYNE